MALFDVDNPEPVRFRRFDDLDTAREEIYANARRAFSEMRPVQNATHRLEIVDVDYDGPYNPTKREEKEALLKRRSLHRPLYGTLRLVNAADGSVLDEQRTVLARIPHLTGRGIFVRNGTVWGVRNQARLRPGIYTRRRSDGSYASQFNVKPGTGRGFHVALEPESGVYKLEVGQSTTRLYPILRALGHTDDELKEAWGEELFRANARELRQRDEADLVKFVKKLASRNVEVTPDLAASILRDTLARTEVDPEVTRLTMGQPIKNLDSRTILDASRRVLRLAQGDGRDDNRDSQAYQSIHSMEDFVRERLARDPAGIARKLLWKAAREGRLGKLTAGLFNKNIDGIFDGSGVAQAIEDVNPFETYDQLQAVTRLGEGGMASAQSASRDARGVQPSYIGVIDAGRGPESANLGLDMRLTDSALKGSDGQLYTEVRNPRTGQLEIVSARTLSDRVVAFPGELTGDGATVRVTLADGSTDYTSYGTAKLMPDVVEIRPSKRVPVVKNGELSYATRDEVDYEIPHANALLSRASAMIPFPQGVKGQRLLMGSRMTQQALSLVEPEAPFVQSADHDGASLHQKMGKFVGNAYAPAAGTVVSVTPDEIAVQDAQGAVHTVDIYNNYPLARKTVLHNTPVVKVGQTVQPGDLLAHSNYSDPSGNASIGRNLRTAFVSFEGDTLEDAFVISESAAKKLAAENLYRHRVDLDDTLPLGKDRYRSIYGDKFTADQYQALDDDGVVQEGAVVNPGDPVILATAPKKRQALGAVMDTPKSAVSDRSEVWDHHAPGIVTNVSKTRSGVRVDIRSFNEVKPGDKLSGRFGNKGVVSRILPDEQMPTDSEGRPFDVLMNAHGIISRVNPSALAEALLGKVAEKTGKPYVVKGFAHDDMARFALDEAKKAGLVRETEDGELEDRDDIIDPRTGRRIPNVFTGNSYIMRLQHMAEGKLSARDQGGYTAGGYPAKGGPRGCFVPKQKILTDQGSVEIARLCEKRMGLSVLSWNGVDWIYRPVTDWFTYRANVSDIRTVKFMAPSSDRTSYGKNSARRVLQEFSATTNHVVYLADGSTTTVGQLNVGDQLVVRGVSPTNDQYMFLVGTLLGDASIHTTPDGFHVFQVEHSLKQVEYVDWKHSILSGLGSRWYAGAHAAGTINGVSRAAVQSRLLTLTSLNELSQLYQALYSSGTKQVTDEVASLIDERALVVWFLDDGTVSNISKKAGKTKLQGFFATNGFSYDSVLRLKSAVERIIDHTTGMSNPVDGQYTICFSQNAALKLAELVARYVPWTAIPKSKRWLRAYVEQRQKSGVEVYDWDTVNRLKAVATSVRSIDPYRHDKPGVTEINVYDFTVDETHNYCAGGALVSNSKRVGLLDSMVLTAAGATNFLRDAKIIRGQRNDEYWRQVREGGDPVEPTTSFANEEFRNMLRAAGVNIRQEGTRSTLAPLLDRDIDDLATYEVENSETLDFDTLKPVDGGLFDVGGTGGAGGDRFAKITLPQKVPHPLFLDPLRNILRLTNREFEEVLRGDRELYGRRGPQALEWALKSVDMDREIELAKNDIRTGRGAARDQAVKRLHALEGLKKHGVGPDQLLLSRIPVIPPKYRPIVTGARTNMVHDLNYLYHDVVEARKNFQDAHETFGDATDEYMTMFNAVRAVVGKHDPVNPKHAEQGVAGVLRHALGVGDTPKKAFFMRRAIGASLDTVGRGVITADPDLDMDEIAVPEDMAWEMFRPYVIRRLRRLGYGAADSVKMVRDRTPTAKKLLDDEMLERPVVYNRAPALHRYAYVGARAKIRHDDAIGLPFQTLKGLGADYDGDQINIHVPASKEAQEDALEKLLPSKNLFFTGDFETHYEPVQDYTMGLYLATRPDESQPVREFESADAARKAYVRGEISARTPIRIRGSD